MFKLLKTAALAGVCLSLAQTTAAEPIIRDAAQFDTVEIAGVSLSTTPEDAFDILFAAGYAAGPIARFEDWQHGSIEFVRGNYGAPTGLSSVSLGRSDGKLVMVSQSLNKPGIDVEAEISAIQGHFGVAADEVDCRLNPSKTGGSCAIRDAEIPDQVSAQFTMTALSTMIMRSVSRPQELINTF